MRRALPLLLLTFALLLSGCGVQPTPTPAKPAGAGIASPGAQPQPSQRPLPVGMGAIPAEEPGREAASSLAALDSPTSAGAVPDGWTTLLDDNFKNLDPDMWATGDIEGGGVELGEGELIIRADTGWQISSYPTVAQYIADGYVSATFKAVGKGRAGVMARLDVTERDSAMYVCWIETTKAFGCHKFVDGGWRKLVQSQSSEVRATGSNTVALQMLSSNLLFSINGKNVASIADRDIASGSWGIFAEGGTDDMTARFTRVVIAAPKGSQRTPTPSPTTARPRPTSTRTPSRPQPSPTAGGGPSHLYALDPGFGSSGKTTLDMGSGLDSVHAVAVQPDGKIVLGGEAWPGGNPNFALARLNPDGSLDKTFGDGGKVYTKLIEQYDYSWVRSLAILPNGKILAAGPARNPENGRPSFGLARYLPNGQLDKSFGEGGKVTTRVTLEPGYNIADEAEAMAVQADGKIVLVGSAGGFPANFALVRYNPDGSLDESFGDDGRVVTDFGFEDRASAVAIQPDGKIIAAGHGALGGESTEAENFAMARYNTDGSLDETFGDDGNGKVLTDISTYQDWANGIALTPDGKIVLGGFGVNGARGCGGTACWIYGMALAQYNADGSLDTAFGSGGKVLVQGQWGSGYALLRLPDGTLALGGYVGQTDFGLAMFDPTGKPLAGFGTDGILRTEFGMYKDQINALALQPDGKIVAAGDGVVDPKDILNADFAVVRYK